MVGFLHSTLAAESTTARVLKRGDVWRRKKCPRVEQRTLFNDLVDHFFSDPAPRLIYQLVNAGYKIQQVNKYNETLLDQCLRRFPTMPSIYHALFQCGATFRRKSITNVVDNDLSTEEWSYLDETEDNSASIPLVSMQLCDYSVVNTDKIDWSAEFQHYPKLSVDVQSIIQAYHPGLWYAVLHDEAETVRRLVGMWCRVDIQNGKRTLTTLAQERENYDIANFIDNVVDSLRFAHAVLAGDNQLVELFLETSTTRLSMCSSSTLSHNFVSKSATSIMSKSVSNFENPSILSSSFISRCRRFAIPQLA